MAAPPFYFTTVPSVRAAVLSFVLSALALAACSSSPSSPGTSTDGGAAVDASVASDAKPPATPDASAGTLAMLEPLTQVNTWRIVTRDASGATSDETLTNANLASGYSYFEAFTTTREHTVSVLFGKRQLTLAFASGYVPKAGASAEVGPGAAVALHFYAEANESIVGTLLVDSVDAAKGKLAGRVLGRYAPDGAEVAMSFNLALPVVTEP